MIFDVLTLFPEMFDDFISTSIIGRAVKSNKVAVNLHNIRDFSNNKHSRVDDYSYGGGSGMLMMPQPLFDAIEGLKSKNQSVKTVYLSPQGTILNQSLAENLALNKRLIVICGHYEGVDQRVLDEHVDYELSIGDYVLTGGELPAMVLIDCISRHIDGVLGNSTSAKDESHSNGMLEYPQYTRPSEFRGIKVPEVLLSGNHAKIEQWRRIESIKNTILKRPDLLLKMTKQEREEILKILLKNNS